MIIDCHCHAGKGDGLTGPWDTRAGLGEYIKQADQYGIHKTVLFSAFHSNYTIANEAVAKIVLRNRDRFYGFAFVHAERDAGSVFQLVKTAVEQYKFCGIKVHKYDARISREICSVAHHFSLPVLYDPMGEVPTIEMIAKEYPQVNFIIPHLSTFSDDWRAQREFITVLERRPNIFCDLSGVRRFDVITEALERGGSHKILFGSDGPWLHPGVELEKIRALPLDEMERENIFSRNFLKLIHS